MRRKNFSLAIFILFSLLLAREVSAQAWWGDGVRSDNWILKHGGALIRFEITNKSGDANEYKAILTRGSKNLEVEVGKSGLFDDALPGKHKVTFYRGGSGKSFDNKGKEIKSISFEVHAGESIKLKLDYSRKKISFFTDYAEKKPVPKAAAVPKAPVRAPAETAEETIEEITEEVAEEVVEEAVKESAGESIEEEAETREEEATEEVPEESVPEENVPDGDEKTLTEGPGNTAPADPGSCLPDFSKPDPYGNFNYRLCGEEFVLPGVSRASAFEFNVSPAPPIQLADVSGFLEMIPTFIDWLNRYFRLG